MTGRVIARFFDLPDGAHSVPIRLASLGTAQPYPPVDLARARRDADLAQQRELRRAQDDRHTVPRAAWAFADCETSPFPGTPDPRTSASRTGSDADRLYELVYTAKDPLVLGVGLAATRDIVSFFRHAKADASGTPNPVAGVVEHAIGIGDSQSGNFIRTFIHLGFNQDTQDRIVWDGVFPRIAARQTPINLRFALPGGAAGMYEPGSDGVVWWTRLRRQGARTEGRGPARSVHRDEDLPEGHRGVRLDGILGPAHVAGSGRHRREARHPAARERPALLLSGHHARRRPRWIPDRRHDGANASARCRPIRTRKPSRRAR